jgi:ankyrin repeat protein
VVESIELLCPDSIGMSASAAPKQKRFWTGDLKKIETPFIKRFFKERGEKELPHFSEYEAFVSDDMSNEDIATIAFIYDFVNIEEDGNEVLDINTLDDRTPPYNSQLHMLVGYAKLRPFVEDLLARGANPNILNNAKETPLMLVCERGTVEDAKLLLENGADVNVKGDGEQSAIYLATRYGAHDILEYLCKIKGADLNAAWDFIGYTPLIQAAEDNDIEAVRILCENGADSTIKDKEGKTAIEIATDDAVKEALKACAQRAGRRKMTRRRKMKRNGKVGTKSKRSKRSKRSKNKYRA